MNALRDYTLVTSMPIVTILLDPIHVLVSQHTMVTEKIAYCVSTIDKL